MFLTFSAKFSGENESKQMQTWMRMWRFDPQWEVLVIGVAKCSLILLRKTTFNQWGPIHWYYMSVLS